MLATAADRERLLSAVTSLNISKVKDAVLDWDINVWTDTRSTECQVQRACRTVQVKSFMKLHQSPQCNTSPSAWNKQQNI